jgi:hypothetical protein
LSSESYINKDDIKVHKPLLEILGWVAPPTAFRPPKLPEVDIKILHEVPDLDKLDLAAAPEDYPDFDPADFDPEKV